jgi:tetratricopeptide (TPR) repeat protein
MRTIAVIFALAPAVNAAGAGDFRQSFDDAARTRDDAKVDRATAAWKAAEPRIPEVYVKAANYYFVKARRERVQVGARPPRKGDFPMKDPESGKIVGSIGPIVEVDPALGSRACEILREAARKFPDRLDIWFGPAYMQRELRNVDGLYATLVDAVKYAADHPAGLKWKRGRPLKEDPAKFMPEHLQPYLYYYFRRSSPEAKERAFRLAELVAASYPKHPYPVNSLGAFCAVKKDWAKALSYFEKAHELAPRDTLIMLNPGRIHAQPHENSKARIYFKKVIASAGPEGIRNKAREYLRRLK